MQRSGRKSKSVGHNNSSTLTSWEARENLLLRLLPSAAKCPSNWLRRSPVWFDWLHLITCLMWLATTDHMSDVIGSTSTRLSLEKITCLIWLAALDQMFDVLGYNWSHVWCDYEVITWETVQQCDRGISSSKTLLLEFCFALFLSFTSTPTTLTFNGFPLNRYCQLELTFCWTQLITGVLFVL